MKHKYVEKTKLITLNAKALRAKANGIDPEFLASISENLKFVVSPALPFPERHGWVRCYIGVGTSPCPGEGEFHSLVLDIRDRDFERLPTVEV